MSEAARLETTEQGPEKEFNRDEAYAEAIEEVIPLIKAERLKGEFIDPHDLVVSVMETLAPQNENFRKLEILAEMRSLMEIDKKRFEKAALHPKAAEMVDQLYEAMKE